MRFIRARWPPNKVTTMFVKEKNLVGKQRCHLSGRRSDTVGRWEHRRRRSSCRILWFFSRWHSVFIAGKMGDRGPGAGCDGPIAKIARDFRHYLENFELIEIASQLYRNANVTGVLFILNRVRDEWYLIPYSVTNLTAVNALSPAICLQPAQP